jgi:hypothetical protein
LASGLFALVEIEDERQAGHVDGIFVSAVAAERPVESLREF